MAATIAQNSVITTPFFDPSVKVQRKVQLKNVRFDAGAIRQSSSEQMETAHQLGRGWSKFLDSPKATKTAPVATSSPVEAAKSDATDSLASSEALTSAKGFNLYSPSVVKQGDKTVMFSGGWKSEADLKNYQDAIAGGADPDTIAGPDKIFRSEQLPDGSWSEPKLVEGLPTGGHLNDPAVITNPDNPDQMMMYYTRLDNADAKASPEFIKEAKADLAALKAPGSGATAAQIADAEKALAEANNFIFEAHDVGFAVSNDGGKTWEDQGLAITREDNGDPETEGAWTPSAVSVKNEKGENEVWLYYTSGGVGGDVKNNIFVQKFDASGQNKLGEPTMVSFGDHQALQQEHPTDPGKYLYTNPEVSIAEDGSYQMVANTHDQKQIVHYTSKDGVNWTPSEEGRVLVEAEEGSSLTAPQLDDNGSLHFGRSKAGETKGGFPHFQIATIESPEAQAERIFPLIGRDATADDIDFWSDQLASGGATETTMIASFLEASKKDNSQIVKDLYGSVLGREANTSAQGLDAWVKALDQGVPLVQVVQSFIDIRNQERA